MYCVFVSVLLCFFFVPLFRGRQLTRRPYGHFAAFLCFRKLFFTYIGVFFVLKHKTKINRCFRYLIIFTQKLLFRHFVFLTLYDQLCDKTWLSRLSLIRVKNLKLWSGSEFGVRDEQCHRW